MALNTFAAESLPARSLVCERVARIDSAMRTRAGGGRPALLQGLELAISRITPTATLETIASGDSGREGSDCGQQQNGGEGC
jgi:hypothetical protein